jgi:hypothetical protein
MASKNRRQSASRNGSRQHIATVDRVLTSVAGPSDGSSSDSISEQLDLIQTQLADLTEAASYNANFNPSDAAQRSDELRDALGEQNTQLNGLAQQLRDDFQLAVMELKETQEAAAASQADVLRTLTATLLQTAATDESTNLATQFADLESRLHMSLRATVSQNAVAAPEIPYVAPVRTDDVSPPADAETNGDDSSRSWSEIRAAFIQSDGETDQTATEHREPPAPEPEPEPEPDTDRDPLAADTDVDFNNTQKFVLPPVEFDCDVPELGDIEAMTPDELKKSLSARDYLVSTLIGQVRRLHDSHGHAMTTEQLVSLDEELPEKLQERIAETLDRMNQQLRLSELEMSLERARLSRQTAQMEQSQESLDRQARQMGLERGKDGAYIIDRSDTTRKHTRRWLGRLGMAD